MPISNNVRRIVTTVDDSGKAVVLFDSDSPHNIKRPDRPNISRLLWVTGESPADISGPADRAGLAMGKIGITPPPGGSVFRIVEFPPVGPEVDKMDNDHLHHQIGGDAPKRGLPPSHPFMHRTRTIDYAIVMDGEIDMLLDDSEIHMKAGDVLIQQGTNHAWVNRGKETCRIAFILIDSQEP
jgi:mannose-6-phosphate isomerase-like protein (cupin superfamily)